MRHHPVTRILLIDDEPAIAETLSAYAGRDGMSVEYAKDGEAGLDLFGRRKFDVVVVDWMLPGISGPEIVKTIREKSDIPILMISARDEESDIVVGLELGADDYVTKPFGADELLARIRAALRHRLQQQGADRGFTSDDLSVDLVRRLVKRGPEDIKLSPKEYDILEQLVIHAGKVLTHKHLLREVWRDESVDPQYLRVYVRQLRQKIEADPSTPRHVLTEPGVGYRLV